MDTTPLRIMPAWLPLGIDFAGDVGHKPLREAEEMRHVGMALLLLIGLAALPAYAGPPFGCCYCTNMVVGDNALLCAALPSGGPIDGFTAECQAINGLVICIAATSPDSCPAAFLEAGITCPPSRPAPVLGATATAVLAVLLAGVGGIALALRRRAPMPR
jgi:hypothetical protein